MCLLATLAVTGLSYCQADTATVSGVITDQSGAVVAGAEVRVTNTDTNVSATAISNDSGVYVVIGLKPGLYRIKVKKDGFNQIDVTDVKLNVQDDISRNFVLPVGSASESISVEGNAGSIETSGSVGTVIDRKFVSQLPLNGRSFNTLLQLTPGVVIAPPPAGQSSYNSPGQFSIAGQRPDANAFTVDGVSANFGISPGLGISASGAGSAQAFSALGGTSSLVSVDALEEFRIETSSVAPEFGRAPGGQVILSTRPGTNTFHGGVFDYFRNTVMDANDWFANNAGNSRAPEHHNDFGGFLGGPIWKDKTFFFFSYEGARLDLPQTNVIVVPSTSARAAAPPAVAPFLTTYPIPNGPVSADGFTAQLTGTFANRATLNATSIRVDHTFNDRFSLFGRYNYAPSQIITRGGGNFVSLNQLAIAPLNTQTVTLGLNMLLSKRVTNTLRANYSSQSGSLSERLDSFGGAVPLTPSLILGPLPSSANQILFIFDDASEFLSGPAASQRTRQMNLLDDLAVSVGVHQFKFGADYRAIYLNTRPRQNQVQVDVSSEQSLISTGQADIVFSAANKPSRILTRAFSIYGQDTWKVSRRLTLTYGLRWELNPAPSALGSTTLASWTNVNNPAQIALAPAGSSLWNTTYGNLAPRFGIAYSLTSAGDFVLRGGGGIFYDLGVGAANALGNEFPNSANTGLFFGVNLPITDPTPYLASLPSLQPPYASRLILGYDPNLNLPRSYEWNVSLEKSFSGKQVISATYLGQAGRDLLRQIALFRPNSNFPGSFLLTGNDAWSNYNALQLQYRRPLSARLQALLNYTWSHSLDNSSGDTVAGFSNTVISAATDYANSDFDVRHSFSGALTFEVPEVGKSRPLALVTNNWSLATVIVARTGFPFNAVYSGPSLVPGGRVSLRPDLVPGQSIWMSSPQAPGGRLLNINAFSIPTTVRQGTEGRNDIPGYGLTQVDLSISRRFPIGEKLNLQFRTDAFNLFNHPNFANPTPNIKTQQGLQSQEMLNQGLGGLNPLFQEGGPRSLQLSLKLTF